MYFSFPYSKRVNKTPLIAIKATWQNSLNRTNKTPTQTLTLATKASRLTETIASLPSAAKSTRLIESTASALLAAMTTRLPLNASTRQLLS